VHTLLSFCLNSGLRISLFSWEPEVKVKPKKKLVILFVEIKRKCFFFFVRVWYLSIWFAQIFVVKLVFFICEIKN